MHATNLRGIFAGMSLAMVALAPQTLQAEPGENPPRYHLNLGQKIEYRDQHESKREDKQKYEFGLTNWVVGENPDKSWRLLFHHEWEWSAIDVKGTTTTAKLSDEYGYFDLFADGRIVPGREGVGCSPKRFFRGCPTGP